MFYKILHEQLLVCCNTTERLGPERTGDAETRDDAYARISYPNGETVISRKREPHACQTVTFNNDR